MIGEHRALAWFRALSCACWLCALQGALPGVARAHVVRFALVVGDNHGAAREQPLLYAVRDAQRVRDVLLALGGYLPENTYLLAEPDAASVRRVLIQLNERIRREVSMPDTQAVLFVYYSGHADAAALHLGTTELELAELRGLVNGSAAQFRVLVLDACRSGAVTRVKGGRPVPAFSVALEQRLSGEGAVFLTSSAADEDAQESDELRGSFFTHYFVSGLLGAADDDRNGEVSLAEVYGYTYAHTLRATSRSFAGSQHPTFRYQLEGRGDLVMTAPRAYSPNRAELVFPPKRSYLVLRLGADGSVVGEVSRDDPARSLSVEPGRYFVRGREADALLEGEFAAAVGSRIDVGKLALDRVEYAVLARKGGGSRSAAHGPELGYRLRTTPWQEASLCQGLMLGYAYELPALSLHPRLAGCLQHFDNSQLHARTQELSLELRAAHAWDPWPRLSVELGVSIGTQLVLQQFDSAGSAPARTSLGASLGVGPGVRFQLAGGWHTFGELSVLTQLYERRDRKTQKLTAVALVSLSVGVGKYF